MNYANTALYSLLYDFCQNKIIGRYIDNNSCAEALRLRLRLLAKLHTHKVIAVLVSEPGLLMCTGLISAICAAFVTPVVLLVRCALVTCKQQGLFIVRTDHRTGVEISSVAAL